MKTEESQKCYRKREDSFRPGVGGIRLCRVCVLRAERCETWHAEKGGTSEVLLLLTTSVHGLFLS